MNPLTNVKNIQKLNQRELELGIGFKTSWHQQYKDSAWIFIGGLPYDLTEGDILAVFSQYGEIVNVNLVRDKSTGKSKGFAFLCFEDQRSSVLTVDNLNGIKLLGRTLRVDHVEKYRLPKETGEEDELTQMMRAEGCAPKTPSHSESEGEVSMDHRTDKAAHKKKKKLKKEKKKKKIKVKKEESSNSESDTDPTEQSRRKRPPQLHDGAQPIKIKEEKIDPRYDKYSGEKQQRDTIEKGYTRERESVKSESRDQNRKSKLDSNLSRERMREPHGNDGEHSDRDRYSSGRDEREYREKRRDSSYRQDKDYDRHSSDRSRSRERDRHERDRRRDR